jgi:hypothetical protein
MIPKKNNLSFFFLLTIIGCNTWSMDEKPVKKIRRWVNFVGAILLGEIPVRQLTIPETAHESGFSSLPHEIQKQIIMLLTTNAGAESLEGAAKAINSLAQVNKQLNSLINDPIFCLHLIKYLSYNFQWNNETACLMLHTQEAKRRLSLQNELKELCSSSDPSPEKIDNLIAQGVDINFTYQGEWSPLMYSTANNNTLMIKTLLNAGVDPESISKHGLTPLLLATQLGGAPETIFIIKNAIKQKHAKK